jgi:hypothetical protein
MQRLGASVRFFAANVNRATSDLNRAESSDSEWRMAVSNEVRQIPRPLALIDVHSFPPTRKERDGWEHKSSFGPYDIIFMTVGRPTQWMATVAGDVQRAVINKNLRVGFAIGSDANDIVLDALEAGVPATLIELSEALVEGQRLEEVPTEAGRVACAAIAAAIMNQTHLIRGADDFGGHSAVRMNRAIDTWFDGNMRNSIANGGNDGDLSCTRVVFVPDDAVPGDMFPRVCFAPCANCGKGPTDAVCMACLSVAYCSRVCEQAHWEVHRKDCQHLAPHPKDFPSLSFGW